MSKRSFTVSYLPQNDSDVPYIRMRGKWINTDLGLNIGDRFELFKQGDMIVLIKIPDEIVKQEKRAKEIKKLEKQLQVLKVSEEKSTCYF
jgi:hypothetical protein